MTSAMTSAKKQLRQQGAAHATGAALQLIYAWSIAVRFCLAEKKVFEWLVAQGIVEQNELADILHLPLNKAGAVVEAVLWDKSMKEVPA